jgi:uncharacterized protein YaiI (UPF0178 family)
MPPHIYIDADACPVKPEAYRVARRYDLRVTLVAGGWMRIRGAGQDSGGPAPFDPRDRSRFLQALDGAIHALRRTKP